jgi:NitT/TauT family transport system substrate-binding protein
MRINQSRRDFLATLSAAGGAGAFGSGTALADEGPPEVTTIRLRRDPAICLGPWDIAEDLLRVEGFTDIRYVPAQVGPQLMQMIGRGDLDFAPIDAVTLVFQLDTSVSITALAGVHTGCLELFAHDRSIQTISDLKGKRVGISYLESSGHMLLAVMVAHVGLDPQKDIAWIASDTESASVMELFAQGKVDAFLGFPPEPQELRARKVGHVILNTTTEKPWSQYYCCMVVGQKEFVHHHPVATKRVVRALLKANDICAAEPERVAQQLVDRGFAGRYDYALETVTQIPYAEWRDFDPEDSLRFYALRLHEVGMIQSSPNAILAEHTDWRFLNELKRELKA